jgi:hypothetical protein
LSLKEGGLVFEDGGGAGGLLMAGGDGGLFTTVGGDLPSGFSTSAALGTVDALGAALDALGGALAVATALGSGS